MLFFALRFDFENVFCVNNNHIECMNINDLV